MTHWFRTTCVISTNDGLKNIQEKLNSNVYPRLRIGVGNDFSKGKQVDYVLGAWSIEESEKLKERLDTSIKLIKSFVLEGINIAMNTYNGK